MEQKSLIPAPWAVLSDELYAPCAVFEVHKRRCAHPDGREGTFYIIESRNGAQAVALTADHQMVLVRQYRFGSRVCSWELPGGLLEPAEDPVVAASRELQEETGYCGERARLIGKTHSNPAIHSGICYCVLLENCKLVSATKWDPFEEIQVATFPIEAVHDMVRKGEITNAMTISGLVFLQQTLGLPKRHAS